MNGSNIDYFLVYYNKFHYVNSYVTTVTGLFFNSLFMFLVLFKTPQSLKPFSKILMVSCVTDYIFIVNDGIGKLVRTTQ